MREFARLGMIETRDRDGEWDGGLYDGEQAFVRESEGFGRVTQTNAGGGEFLPCNLGKFSCI